jgi:chaperonin GroEL
VLAKLRSKDDVDYNLGLDILVEALARPIETIAANAGHDGPVIAHRVLREKSPSWGFNALQGEYVDMFEAGIVDPAKVTKSALQNAVSVASLLLTTDALIANKPEKKRSGGGGPDMDGMDDMGGMGGMDGMGGMGF